VAVLTVLEPGPPVAVPPDEPEAVVLELPPLAVPVPVVAVWGVTVGVISVLVAVELLLLLLVLGLEV
jgi:hypothetical protein